MRRLLMIGLVALSALPLAARDATTCDDINVNFGDRETVRSSEVLTVPGGPLNANPGPNGGVSVIGGSGTNYRVQVCKAASSNADLGRIKVQSSAGSLRVEGPRGDWNAFLIIEAPANWQLNVETLNGPISVKNLQSAKLTARAQNGPLSVKDSTGSIDGKTQNGPISVSGSTGDFKLVATNGPVSVKLAETQWSGGLEAATTNGPLSVTLPKGFTSGVVIESRGHGPVSCDCDDARKTWDDDTRRIEFGNGPAVVRLSTVNGPVSVKSK